MSVSEALQYAGHSSERSQLLTVFLTIPLRNNLGAPMWVFWNSNHDMMVHTARITFSWGSKWTNTIQIQSDATRAVS